MQYTKTIRIANYECDIKNRVKLGFILRHLQEISGEHLDELGLPYPLLRENGQVFLLNKVDVALQRRPHSGETVRLVTAPKRPVGAQFIRCSAMVGENQEPLLHADTFWSLVDPETRRILRPRAFMAAATMTDSLEPMPQNGKQGQMDVKANIQMHAPEADALEDGGRVTVSLSMLDVNRHMNNAHYADLITDAIPLAVWDEKEPVRFLLHYQREALLATQIAIQRGRCADGSWYVTGAKTEGKCFEAVVTFEGLE